MVTVAILAQGTLHGQSTTCWPVFSVSPNCLSGTGGFTVTVAILAQGTFHDQKTFSAPVAVYYSKPVAVYLRHCARLFFFISNLVKKISTPQGPYHAETVLIVERQLKTV